MLTALGRIFVHAIFSEQKRQAGSNSAACGAMVRPQRFGGSVNLNLHFHALILDGVYLRDQGTLRFQAAAPPSQEMLERVARQVRDRSLRWLKAKGYLDARPAEERGNDSQAPSALDACATLALQGGAFLRLDAAAKNSRSEDDDDGFGAVSKKRFSVDIKGFNVNAAVRVGADMDEARERLVRYCARPAIALGRITRLPDGRIAYLLKYARRGATHRVMTPMEFMSRICALIPGT